MLPAGCRMLSFTVAALLWAVAFALCSLLQITYTLRYLPGFYPHAALTPVWTMCLRPIYNDFLWHQRWSNDFHGLFLRKVMLRNRRGKWCWAIRNVAFQIDCWTLLLLFWVRRAFGEMFSIIFSLPITDQKCAAMFLGFRTTLCRWRRSVLVPYSQRIQQEHSHLTLSIQRGFSFKHGFIAW